MTDIHMFSLGFDGEYWSAVLGGLVIPIPGDRHIVVQRTKFKDGSTGYHIFHKVKLDIADDLFMAVALVQNTINHYRSE